MPVELPAQRLDQHLLVALESGPAHGFALLTTLRQRAGDDLAVDAGSLYPALRRLEEAGLVVGEWTSVGDRRRRCYRLTAPGRRRLAHRPRVAPPILRPVEGWVS